MNRDLSKLEEKVGYVFSDKSLLAIAFIHRSYGNEHARYRNVNNERMELLGDAVLDLIVTEYLYKNLTGATEGDIARLKAMVVSEPILSKISKEMDLGSYLRLSKGELHSGGRERRSILGDCYEALLGAIYLDSNYEKVREVSLKHIKYYIDNIDANEATTDYKTQLQEYCQKEYKVVPTYEMVNAIGPDHSKTFETVVKMAGLTGSGIGKNKRTAEQNAAKNLLISLGIKINETL